MTKSYHAIVVGGGHAGIEAALALARTHQKTLMLTAQPESIGRMSCNPAIGGLAKGHIAIEIDVLGGEMGKASDANGIQFRMLNTSKGEAVWAPRAQMDKAMYSLYMKYALEAQENLFIVQDTAKAIIFEHGKVKGILTERNQSYYAPMVIITTGTFLKGLVHIGEYQAQYGRMGEKSANYFSDSLIDLGFEVGRLKTGTPPRIHYNSINFDRCEKQDADNFTFCFSHTTQTPPETTVDCWITYTNERTQEIVDKNIHRAPLFTGQISAIGPRYCPSFETKIVRFPDKQRHQVFIEPEGRHTKEVYLNGLSTSLPEEVQWDLIHTIPGLEEAHIIRMGYAIEYDFINPIQLKSTLESQHIPNLYFAGQINGTSGYEEAAAQGLLAGINASLALRGEDPLVLDRTESYIGVLIDDLVTKGVDEPYRMFTARAEYRLNLRWDNSDARLMKYGHRIGLIADAVMEKHQKKWDRIQSFASTLETTRVGDKPISELYKDIIKPNSSIAELIQKPQLPSEIWQSYLPNEVMEDEQLIRQAGILLKYKGYIQRQQEDIDRFRRLESKRIPYDFNYDVIPGLLTEALEKLKRIRPASVGQAARISGVNPSDISLLLSFLRH